MIALSSESLRPLWHDVRIVNNTVASNLAMEVIVESFVSNSWGTKTVELQVATTEAFVDVHGAEGGQSGTKGVTSDYELGIAVLSADFIEM